MKKADRILIVNLTDQSYHEASLPEEVSYRYLGGRGLGAYLLAEYLPPGTAPYDEATPLIFVVGPLQGTRAPFSSKVVLTTKSPLTDIYLFSIASGNLGHALARCGYRALVITGCSATPCYLWIGDHGVEFRSASHLWGVSTSEAQSMIVQEVSCPEASTATIGPAGEKQVRFANVITGGPKMRAFGRGGAGAVMGSKRLKGLAIRGNHPMIVSDVQTFREATRIIGRAVAARPDWVQRRRREGTTTSMEILQEYGMLPTRNWQRGSFERFERLAPLAHRGDEPWHGESVPCAPLCPAPCARRYRVVGGEYADMVSEGPDYETIYALGTNCGIDRFDALVAADKFCDEMGMDTISAGVVLSFAMECYERKLISDAELDGVELNFGNHRELLIILQRIANRNGFGNLLAEGVRRCAEAIGQGSEAFAMHAKGLELGGWGCRAAYGQSLQYALGSRGGCHHDLGIPAKVEYATPDAITIAGKGHLVLHTASGRIARDSAIICSFSSQYVDLEPVAMLLSGIWGVNVSSETLMLAGERILNMERLLNVREGINRGADQLPARLLQELLPDGPRQGSTVPLEALKTEFYATAGWDIDTGVPLPATLERLGIGPEAHRLLGSVTGE
jgi:aldehyde:ferredoxin oxidoreductase